jgi:hypothetical protein
MSNEELQDIYDCNIKFADEPIDELHNQVKEAKEPAKKEENA